MRPALRTSGILPSLHQFLTHCAETLVNFANDAGLSSVCAGLTWLGLIAFTRIIFRILDAITKQPDRQKRPNRAFPTH